MEKLGLDVSFWRNKTVFLTGHTGFKGAWMCLLLKSLGAKIIGYSLDPLTTPSLFEEAQIAGILERDYRNDITNLTDMASALSESQPDVVIHMAAQSLVIEGYDDPVGTYSTNVMGTVNILEAVRKLQCVKAVLVITTDKCYKNIESKEGYVETDRLGGVDPYSNSKACAELVVDCYRNSYYSSDESANIDSARAGNVIGGGDWSDNRLIPDCIRAFDQKLPLQLRSPKSVRPWQHVLEPLTGYLLLVQSLCDGKGGYKYPAGWNFGPNHDSEVETQFIAETVATLFGEGNQVEYPIIDSAYKETHLLRLKSDKANDLLNWYPKWDISQTLAATVEWYSAFLKGEDAQTISFSQIENYFS